MRPSLVFFCLANVYSNTSIKSGCSVWKQRTCGFVRDDVDHVDVEAVDDGDDDDDEDDEAGVDVDDGKVRKWNPKKCGDNVDQGAGRDNGFGNDYVWAGSLQSGLELASRHRRPVMLIIHKSWCGACRRLAPKFAQSQDIQALSKHFVLVNVIDEEEPEGNKYAPDGSYIPRILFLSPSGDVYEDIYNERSGDEFRYFYNRPDDIADSMRRLLRQRDRLNG